MAHVLRLTPDHAAAYRAFMLGTYARQPAAFTATVAEREPLPLDWWAARLSADWVAGAFSDRQLVGAVGLRRQTRPRTKHKATLFGLAVHPSARGQGIGRALVEAVLEAARAIPGLELVQLTVTESNTPARRLYTSCGFEVFGTEPMAIRVGDRFEAKVHMWRTTAPSRIS